MSKTYQSKTARKSMTFNRYMQLIYYVRDYFSYSNAVRARIRKIAVLCVGEKYADVFLMAQVKGTPYKSIDIPYSAHGYSNVRSKFYRKLDEDLKNR